MSVWYYEQDGAQMGPVSLDDLKTMVAQGTVRRDSLVWNESMENWQPLAAALPAVAATAAAAPPPSPSGGAGAEGENPYQSPQSSTTAQPGGVYVPNPIEKNASTAMGLGIGSIVGAICCAIVGLILGIFAVIKASEANRALDAEPDVNKPNLQQARNNANIGKITGIIGIVVSVLNGAFGVFYYLGALI